VRVLSSVVAALLLSAPAFADSTGEAREHFKKAQTHYALGEFEDAAREFRETYRLREEPALLFNIGQAYRQMQKWQQAYFYYRQYLSKQPDAPNRVETESLVEQMRRRMDEEEEQRSRVARDHAAARNSEDVLPAAAKPAAPPPAVAASPAVALSAAPWRPAPVHLAGYVALGAGVVAEGIALLMHNSAQSSADQFNQKHAGGTLTASDVQLRSDADSKGRVATVAAVGGLVLLASGAVLSFVF
jgi:tetratricopeptide (TPR) repeat protein